MISIFLNTVSLFIQDFFPAILFFVFGYIVAMHGKKHYKQDTMMIVYTIVFTLCVVIVAYLVQG